MTGVRFYRDQKLPFFEYKLCNAENLCYKKHTHEEYSLALVENGRSRFWYTDKQVEIGAGNLVLIPPHVLHACNPCDVTQWQYKMLSLRPDWVRDFLKNEGLAAVSAPVVRNSPSPAYTKTLASLMDSLMKNGTPLEKEGIIMLIMAEFLGGIKSKLPVIADCGRLRPNLQKVIKYLQEHFLEKVTLDELEIVSGLNKFYLVRLFKTEYSVPPHAYQTLLRINYAKRQLRQQRRITDIALEVGFFDQSHFTKVFKSYVGATPENYQKSL